MKWYLFCLRGWCSLLGMVCISTCVAQTVAASSQSPTQEFPTQELTDAPREKQLMTAEGDALAKILQDAKEEYQPPTPSDLHQEIRELSRATAALSTFLDGGGQVGVAWKQFLHWPVLQAQLIAGAGYDRTALEKVERRFASDEAGLEMSQFADVRRSIRRCLRLRDDLENTETIDRFSEHVDQLAARLPSAGALDDSDVRYEIASHFGWLHGHEQLGWLTESLRRRYSHPNLLLSVSNHLVDEAVTRPIDETMSFNQTMDKVAVRGNARVIGTVRAQLVPHDSKGRIEVQIKGSVKAPMRGTRGPASVNVVADADIVAFKPLLLTAVGADELSPQTDVRACARITGASSTLRGCLGRVVSRLAYRVGSKKKPEIATSAARQVRKLLNERIEKEAGKMLGQFNDSYLTKLRNPLLRRDAFPERLAFHTTTDRLWIDALQAAPSQLGAPGPPPEMNAYDDVAVLLHESAVDNFADSMFRGRTYNEQQLRSQWEQLTGAGEKTAKPPAGDEVAITFSDRQPITLRIDDGTLALTVRGKRFIVRNRSYPPMNITLRYSVKQVGRGYELKSAGAALIVPPRFTPDGPNRYSARESALRRILSNRLARDLPKEISDQQVTLPKPLGNIKMLLVTQLTAENGWLRANLLLPVDPLTPQSSVLAGATSVR